MAAFDLLVFRRQLAETITWSSVRFTPENVKDSLRTIEPAPPAGLLNMPENAREDAIQAVIKQRNKNLRHTKQTLVSNLRVGRLLILDLDCSLSDGAATIGSRGFIDEDYFPAWDTWVYYGSERLTFSDKSNMNINYLISWVPPQIVDLVGDAIQSDPAASIDWLSDFNMDFAFLKLLKQSKLLL